MRITKVKTETATKARELGHRVMGYYWQENSGPAPRRESYVRSRANCCDHPHQPWPCPYQS